MVASSKSTGTRRHGEIIETSTTHILAESDQLHHLPALGSLVRTDAYSGDVTTYGIVSFGATGGLDASRKAVRRGSESMSDHAIYQRHPELEMVLRTTFEVAVVGYADERGVHHHLPAHPASLHFSVRACTQAEVEAFCRQPGYLSLLLSYRGNISPEQLIAGHLRWVDQTLDDGHAWLRDATRRLARLMKRDYDTFAIVLQAIAPD